MPITRANGIDVGYDIIGEGTPLLLITGLGCQRLMWPDGLCDAFARRGFQVIRTDHRDVGESSRTDGPPPPPVPVLVARALAGLPAKAPYDLDTLADDAVGLLDALGVPSAHVVGASMGGMIAQTLAIRYPQRVRTLTSIMSSPGGRRYLTVHPKVMRPFLGARPKDRDGIIAAGVALFRAIGSPGYPFDEAEHTRLATLGYERGHNPHAFGRHLAAALGRRRPLEKITAPTLVIHGDSDPLVPVRGGRDTARAIRGARELILPGMGHDLPRALWERMAEEIAEHARKG